MGGRNSRTSCSIVPCFATVSYTHLDVYKRQAQNLWDAGLKPLGSYLLTDFAPSVANAFSEAFAPITGDVISAKLQMLSLIHS